MKECTCVEERKDNSTIVHLSSAGLDEMSATALCKLDIYDKKKF